MRVQWVSVARKGVGVIVALVIPIAAFAAPPLLLGCSAGERSVCGLILRAAHVLSLLVPVLIGALLIAFALGVARFLWSAQQGGGDLKEKRYLLVWGVLGIAAVMLMSGVIMLLRAIFFGR